MWSYRLLRKIRGCGMCHCHYSSTSSKEQFNFKRALVVSKMTRYELEQYHNSDLSKDQMEKWLKQRGSDYNALIGNHNLHKRFENHVVHVLEQMNIETRVVNRLNYHPTDVNWCDIVIPVGGDGTFLVAASRVSNNLKPVVGFNSDPVRSEGFLCLNKKYSSDVESAFKMIFEGNFSWLFRSRIRITLKGLNICEPVQLSEKEVMFKSPLRKYDEVNNNNCNKFEEKVLPYRALNEVFIGECLSARVSYFELQLAQKPITKVKSSGLCISTGTGSSSWHYSMNRLDEKDAQQLLKMADISLASAEVNDIVTRYNNSLIFEPDYFDMIYTIRDLISAGVWPDPPGLPSRGTCRHVSVHSKCIDAGLVIDGGLLYPFNDGTVAELEILPQDSLRTIVLD